METPPLNLLKDVPGSSILALVLLVLKTHYERQAGQIAEILEGFDHLNLDAQAGRLEELRQKCGDDRQAIQLFTEWIAATLDGGNLSLPES